MEGGDSKKSHGGDVKITSGTSGKTKNGNIIVSTGRNKGAISGDGENINLFILHVFN